MVRGLQDLTIGVAKGPLVFANGVVNPCRKRVTVPGGFARVLARRGPDAADAILALSTNTKIRTLYCHTGWIQDDGGSWYYLHAKGGIGKGGQSQSFAVKLTQTLSRFRLPAPPTGEKLTGSVKALVRVLDVASDAITVPLLALVAAAPLRPWLDVGFTVWLMGPSGGHKTSIAEVIQAAFGAGRKPLAGWNSTALSLQKMLARAKDVVAFLDDFKPRGSDDSVNKASEVVRSVIQAVADHTGRLALRPDGEDRPVYIPQCSLLSTAERAPQGSESDRARILVLEKDKEEREEYPELSKIQAYADDGTLASATAGYIRWLATKAPLANLQDRADAIRAGLLAKTSHPRTAEILSSLLAASEVFVRFVGEEVDAELASDLGPRLKAALESEELLGWQASFQKEESFADRFMKLLRSGLLPRSVR